MTLSGILRGTAAALCVVLAGGCGGGGGDTVEPFRPTGVVAFGDELSVLGPGGAKYTVNALEEDGTISCDTYPLWIQVVARDFGMRFETDPCLEADEVPRGRIFATPGAKVADVATQVEHLLAAEFKSRRLDPKTAPLYAQMLVGMVALTGQWWLDSPKFKKVDVAAHLVNLAWNGLSGLEAKPRLSSRR